MAKNCGPGSFASVSYVQAPQSGSSGKTRNRLLQVYNVINALTATTPYRSFTFIATAPTLVRQIVSWESNATFAAGAPGNITRTYWQHKGSTFPGTNQFLYSLPLLHIAGQACRLSPVNAMLRTGDSIVLVIQDPGVTNAAFFVHTELQMVEFPDRPQFTDPHPRDVDFTTQFAAPYHPGVGTVIDNPNQLNDVVVYDVTF